MCILSTTWFGVAPPLLQPFLGQSCRGILHWESFLENLVDGSWEIHPFGPLGSWYPGTQGECQPGGLVPQTKMNSIVPMEEEGEPTKKTPMICWKWTHVQKTTFQRFWVVSEADLKIQAANSNTKASLKYLADQKKHLTWNPGCFYVVEFTTSLYRDHNQRFLRFLIIYQPCFSFHITIKWTVCRQCSRDSQGFSSSIVPIFGLAVALSRTSMEMNGSWWWKCRCYMQVFGGVVDALTLVVKSTYG